MITSPLSGQVISGNSLARMNVSTTSITVVGVVFYINDAPIGPGQFNSSNNSWVKEWPSTLFSNGNNYNLKARVNYTSTSSGSGTNQTCDTSPVSITINNLTTTQMGNLIVALRPEQWSGPTNVAVPIEVTVGLQNSTGTQEVTTASNYAWSTNFGTILGSGPKVTFSSGPSAGTGAISLTVSYSGKSITKTIPVEVSAYQADSTYPSTTSTTTSGTTTINTPTNGTSPAQGAIINKLKEGDSQLTSCLQQKLGQNTSQRLTYQQFLKTSPCFEARRNVIPANLAPIPPEKIEKLPQLNNLLINKPTNPDKDPNKLIISGKANANQQLFIYIFSEPLVLSAKADGSGNWSYTLEDPLEPGEHKAYIAVEDTDGKQVRSNASIFGVEAVASSSTNPKGLSLAIKNSSSNSTYLYIGSSVALFIAAASGILIIHKFKASKIKPASPEIFSSNNATGQAPNNPDMTTLNSNTQQTPTQESNSNSIQPADPNKNP
jgi:hypothetical protein